MAGPFTWIPESGLPLTRPAISGTAFELSSMNLWAEYLNGYFNGNSHNLLNGNLTAFQLVPIVFGQAPIPQPLDGAVLQVILANSGTGIQESYSGAWQTRQTVGLEFYVRASVKTPRADGWNDDFLCRNIADCLYALLLDRGASIPLQAAGMRRIRPSNPAIIYDPLYKTRRVRCTVNYWFGSPASNGVTSQLGGDN